MSLRTAKFEVTQSLLFELFGLRDFRGSVSHVSCNYENDNLIFEVSGYDDRLPNREDFPPCNVVCKTVQSRFEVIP